MTCTQPKAVCGTAAPGRKDFTFSVRKMGGTHEEIQLCKFSLHVHCTLYRENELLKHQLKKYVGAVQKLRDGPQAYETLAQLEGAKVEEGSNKYIDYHYEASEYEKKLIQVSDH